MESVGGDKVKALKKTYSSLRKYMKKSICNASVRKLKSDCQSSLHLGNKQISSGPQVTKRRPQIFSLVPVKVKIQRTVSSEYFPYPISYLQEVHHERPAAPETSVDI